MQSVYLTEKELCAYLSASRSTARKFGSPARVKIGSRAIRYDLRIIERLLSENN